MNLKNTLISITIFGAGVGTGYFICKRMLNQQYQDDLEEVKNLYYSKIEDLGVMSDDFVPDHEKDMDDMDEEPEEAYEASEEYFNKIKKYSSAIRQEGRGTPIVKYNKPPLDQIIYDEGDEEEDLDDIDDPIDLAYEAEMEARSEEFARRKHENRTNGLPYVIDYNEFTDGPSEYDKQCWYYYMIDRVLCEDDDSIVEDEEELVGLDYEDVLDMQTTVWVRNDTLNTLYEIHRIDDSYKMAVEGIVETPREREYRILGRRKQALDD